MDSFRAAQRVEALRRVVVAGDDADVRSNTVDYAPLSAKLRAS